MKKSLVEIHEDVPADHYDKGIKKNLFQKYWHSTRFNQVLNIVKVIEQPVLDIGCHSGTFTSKIISKFKIDKIFGIDISPSAIALAKKRIPNGKFLVADASKLSFKNDSFSTVFCLEVLEHVDNPKQVLAEIKRVLKKSGQGIILVPTDNSLFRIVWFIWTMVYPLWRHAHVQSFSKDNLEKDILDLGFKIQQTKLFNLGMLKLVVFTKN